MLRLHVPSLLAMYSKHIPRCHVLKSVQVQPKSMVTILSFPFIFFLPRPSPPLFSDDFFRFLCTFFAAKFNNWAEMSTGKKNEKKAVLKRYAKSTIGDKFINIGIFLISRFDIIYVNLFCDSYVFF